MTLLVVKESDQSKTSDTTPAADDELFLPTSGGGRYLVDGFIIYSSAAASIDLKLGFGHTGSLAAMGIDIYGYNTSVVWTRLSGLTSAGSYTAVDHNATGAMVACRFNGFITVTTTGIFSVDWSQNATSGTAMTVKAGSWMRFDEA